MSFWRRLFGRKDDVAPPPRLDYVNEGLALERQGDYEAALTSYRLAHREKPDDPRIVMNMAICYTKTGQPDEAIRQYRRALDLDPQLGGAHYGIAFLYRKRGEPAKAAEHLRAFLARPPKSAEAERWVQHAEQALRELEEGASASDDSPVAPA